MMKIPVEFNSGGHKIHGQFYFAGGELPLPTVLLLGGFPPAGGDSLFAQKMVQHGISTLTFNFRGTLKSEGTITLRNVQEDIQYT
jgi:hypothetical protein